MKQVQAKKEQKLIRTCSVWRALEVIGDTPTLLILEAIWLGDRRFDQILSRSGQQRALVSNRLKKLIEANLLEKKLYTNTPPRYEYIMSSKGVDLYWVALMLLRWERTWSKERHVFVPSLTHTTCGQVTTPEPYCGHCKEIIHVSDVRWEEGPGVGLMAPVYSRRRRQRREDVVSENQKPSLFLESAELMGDRWSSLILRSIFTNLNKFDEILEDTAIATNILSERLGWLIDRGIILSVQYQTNPDRFEYKLTKKGYDYYPVLVMLQQWGDKYYASPEGLPVILYHKKCGHLLNAFVGCSECKEPIKPTEVKFELHEVERNS